MIRVFAVVKSYVDALKLSKAIPWQKMGYMLSIEFTPISAIDKIHNIGPDILVVQKGILHVTARSFIDAALKANPEITIIMIGFHEKDVTISDEERHHIVFIGDFTDPAMLSKALEHRSSFPLDPSDEADMLSDSGNVDILESFSDDVRVQMVFLMGEYADLPDIERYLSRTAPSWKCRIDDDGILLATDEPLFCCSRSGKMPTTLTDFLIAMNRDLSLEETRCILVAAPSYREHLAEEYARMVKLKEFGYFCETCEILNWDLIHERVSDLDTKAAERILSNLFTAVISGDTVAVSRETEELYLGLIMTSFSHSSLHFLRQRLSEYYRLVNDVLHNIAGAVLFVNDQTFTSIEKEVDYVSARFMELIPLSQHTQIHEKVASALSIVLENYSEVESLDDVADRLHITKTYLSKVFKEDLDINFVMFLSRIRISKAKELMLLGNHNITQISREVGYEDPKYFTRVFKRITGETPSQYASTLTGTVKTGGAST